MSVRTFSFSLSVCSMTESSIVRQPKRQTPRANNDTRANLEQVQERQRPTVTPSPTFPSLDSSRLILILTVHSTTKPSSTCRNVEFPSP